MSTVDRKIHCLTFQVRVLSQMVEHLHMVATAGMDLVAVADPAARESVDRMIASTNEIMEKQKALFDEMNPTN